MAVRGKEAPRDEIYLWPECVDSWLLFEEVATQWRGKIDGAMGLDYPGVEVVMKHWPVKKRDARRVFFEIKAMERATLQAWREQLNE